MKFEKIKIRKAGEINMKKLISALIIAALAVVCGFAESAPKSMAVATFDVTGNAVSSDEAESITELYTLQNLFQPEKFLWLTARISTRF